MLKNRFIKLWMAACITAGIAISAVPVLATGTPTQGTDTGGAESSAAITMSAVLEMDPCSAVPDRTFTFTAVKKSLNGTAIADPDTDTTMPAIGAVTLNTLNATATQAADITTQYSADNAAFHAAYAPASDRYKTVTMTSKDMLTGVEFDHAGVYMYEITETEDTADTTVSYSKAKYTMAVYVANKYTDNTKTVYADGVYVSSVGIWKTIDDKEAAVTDKNDAAEQGAGVATAGLGEKVDATGNGRTGATGETQFEFSNAYTPLSPLMIKNTVAGSYADRSMQTAYTTALTMPATSEGAATYTALICKNGSQITGSGNTVDFNKADTYTASFSLKDGEYLLFVDNMTDQNGLLPSGTSYTVSMTPADSYVLSVAVHYANGSAAGVNDADAVISDDGAVTTANTATNAKLTVGDVSAIPAAADKLTANQTAVTSTYKTVTPTGIIMNNLPGILLIVIAVGGMCLYLYSRSRKNRKA